MDRLAHGDTDVIESLWGVDAIHVVRYQVALLRTFERFLFHLELIEEGKGPKNHHKKRQRLLYMTHLPIVITPGKRIAPTS